MLLCSLFLFAGRVQAVSEPTSVTHAESIDLACKEAVASEEAFRHFRRSWFCLRMIDTCQKSQGWQFLYFISHHYPHLLNHLDQFRENDLIGNPLIESFDQFGFFCPSTLRYMKIAGDLEALFGDLNGKTVVEIGGGYGGQCRILSTLFSFKEYILVDLPEVLELAKKCLEKWGVKNVRYVTPDQIPLAKTYDLLISNYAFSECSYKTQVEYTEKLLKHSKSGYMICNDFGYFRKQTFKEYFPAMNFQFTPEIPQTGSSNYVISW